MPFGHEKRQFKSCRTATIHDAFASIHGPTGQIIKKDGKRIGSFKLSATESLFYDTNSKNALFLNDTTNNNDSSVILVPFSLDEDGDKHYRVLYIKADGKAELDTQNDVSNPIIDKDTNAIFSESIGLNSLGNSPDDPYEKYALQRGYVFDNGKIIPAYEISITYHSETNIYCFSERSFDLTLGELGIADDDWLSPDEYATEREQLASLFFSVDIP